MQRNKTTILKILHYTCIFISKLHISQLPRFTSKKNLWIFRKQLSYPSVHSLLIKLMLCCALNMSLKEVRNMMQGKQ